MEPRLCHILVAVWFILVGTSNAEARRPYTEQEKATRVVEGQYLLLLHPGNSARSLSRLQNSGVLRNVRELKVGRLTVLSARVEPGDVALVEGHPAVKYIEPNGLTRLIEPMEILAHPNRDHFGRSKSTSGRMDNYRDGCHEQSLVTDYDDYGTWGLIRTSYWNPPNFHQQPYLWEYDGQGVLAYVFDTGIELNHTEFQGRAIHGMYAQEFADEGIHDYSGHGTHVASTVAGAVYGVAKNATMVDIKVLGGDGWGLLESNIEGLGWVAADVLQRQNSTGRKVKGVINMSLGYGWHSHIFHAAMQVVVDLGITSVVAAGNSATDGVIFTPAAFDNTVTVAASDRHDEMIWWSNFGPIVDIVAPGVNVTGAWAWRSARCVNQTDYQCLTTVSGTSMASPHVAGVVARYLSAIPEDEFDMMTDVAEHVRGVLHDTAGKGFVQFQDDNQRTTPNRLLYHGCGVVPPDQTTTTTTTTPAPPVDENGSVMVTMTWSLVLMITTATYLLS